MDLLGESSLYNQDVCRWPRCAHELCGCLWSMNNAVEMCNTRCLGLENKSPLPLCTCQARYFAPRRRYTVISNSDTLRAGSLCLWASSAPQAPKPGLVPGAICTKEPPPEALSQERLGLQRLELSVIPGVTPVSYPGRRVFHHPSPSPAMPYT